MMIFSGHLTHELDYWDAIRYVEEHPDDEKLIVELKELMAQQIPLLEAALAVHRSRVNEALQPLQERLDVCFTQMRSHVESRYGKRDIDPQLARHMAQFSRNQRQSANGSTSTASVNRLSVGSCGDDAPTPLTSQSNRRANASSVVMSHRTSNASTVSHLFLQIDLNN